MIDHLNLAIRAGETLALVGPSGGGKSTTCSLLPRFYDVDSGSISIDGQDVRSVTQRSLREAIGLDETSSVLLFSTEGDTDPGHYRAQHPVLKFHVRALLKSVFRPYYIRPMPAAV